MREEYPEGFQWDCCEKLGNEGGCKRGRHQADPRLLKEGKDESESELDSEISDHEDSEDAEGSEEDEGYGEDEDDEVEQKE